MTKKLVSFDDQAEPGQGLPAAVKAELNATYRSRLRAIPSSSMPTTPTPMPTVSTFSPASPTSIQTTTDWTWTALDANAKIRFTAPPSGKVVVRMSGAGQDLYTSSGLQWAIMGSFPTGVPEPVSEVIVISANTAATQHTRLEHTFTLNGLEPGKRYEYWWAHRCLNGGKFAHTNAGGVYGPAVISVTPVSDRITETGLNAVVSPSDYSPLWMSGDRTTFYATDYGKPDTGGRLGWSTDDGQTWHDTDHVFYSIQGVRECEDGEILVFTGDLGAGVSNCAVWRSTGWQADHKTATFTKTHEALMSGQSWAGWSISKHGPVIVAAEYGTKASPADMARYAYLSEDDGRTWRPIFDLADPAHSTGIGAHMHGVCYDPWWDAIWIAVGDGPGNTGIFVSWDRGNTWEDLNHEHQMTSVYALPDRVMFITDEAPNGIWAIMRTTPGQLRFEKVFAADNDPTNLTVLGSSIFQAQSMPGAPIVVAVMSGVPGPGRLWASYDGQVWVELWKDNVNATNHGLTYVAGPSLSGKFLGALNRVGDLKIKVTFSPPA